MDTAQTGVVYAACAAAARRVCRAVERRLRAGRWEPTAVEQRICRDVVAATWIPCATLPPHTADQLYPRLRRISVWAAAIRLAMRAGGWPLTAPHPDQVATLGTRELVPGLLSALYSVAAFAETWHSTYDRQPWEWDEAQHDRRLRQVFPDLDEQLGDAERFFTGFGSVGEILIAIADARFD